MDEFHVYSALAGMVLSAVIMLRGSWYNKANLFLGAHFMVTSFLVLVFSFGFKGDSLFWTALLMGTGLPVYFIIGPIAYFYVRSVVTDQSKLYYTDYLHFIPFIIQLIFMAPYYFTSWEHKLAMAAAFQNGDARHLSLNFSLIPDLFNSFLSILHLFVYLVFVVAKYLKFKKYDELTTFNDLPFKFTKRWLVLFILTIVILLINTTNIAISQIFTPSRSEFMATQPVFVNSELLTCSL